VGIRKLDDLHIDILRDLIGFETVTPNGQIAIDYVSNFLRNLGFRCFELNFNGIANLYARFGNTGRNLCFAGHVDVVPPGNHWTFPPFELTREAGKLYGRGANDMKGPLAACLAAVRDFVRNLDHPMSLSIMLTSDEELMGENGTKKIIDFLMEKNEKIDGCILCESCCPNDASGNYIKVGCRGSLNVEFLSHGTQCHVVNGKIFGNHLQRFISFLNSFLNENLDAGTEKFAPSSIEITSVDVGNDTRNIIPNLATARLNIRFNDAWNFEKLEQFIKEKSPENIETKFERFYESVICSDQKFIDFVEKSISRTTGITPEVGTLGGNSDAIFIRKITDVVEVGSPISGAHIVDEFITEEDLIRLREIYYNIMCDFAKYSQ
jgi:succinyl-diaminopimelate desuccinylase